MYARYVKRVLDIMFALMLLPLALPVIMFCGLLIWLEDKGPIFYWGMRLGRYGKPFRMLKLRSMKVNAPDIRNADLSAFNAEKDERLTKVGRFIRKTSLDELPQLFNILRGDMSFIGPRPDLPDAMACYLEDELRKLDVRPGISGFSQAFYRNSISQRDKFKNDLYYVEHVSLGLDLAILFATFSRVIGKKDIHSRNSEMPVRTERKDSINDRKSKQGSEYSMIAGDKVRLRALMRKDSQKILDWVNQPELRYYVGTVFPVSDVEHEKWYEEKLCAKTSRIFGIEESGSSRLIGIIGLNAIDFINRNAELFLYIGEESNRGKGLGSDAVKAMIRFSFEELNLHRIFLNVFSYNTRAIHVYEKAGFVVEGIMKDCLFKAGKYHDKVIMAKVQDK